MYRNPCELKTKRVYFLRRFFFCLSWKALFSFVKDNSCLYSLSCVHLWHFELSSSWMTRNRFADSTYTRLTFDLGCMRVCRVSANWQCSCLNFGVQTVDSERVDVAKRTLICLPIVNRLIKDTCSPSTFAGHEKKTPSERLASTTVVYIVYDYSCLY